MPVPLLPPCLAVSASQYTILTYLPWANLVCCVLGLALLWWLYNESYKGFAARRPFPMGIFALVAGILVFVGFALPIFLPDPAVATVVVLLALLGIIVLCLVGLIQSARARS